LGWASKGGKGRPPVGFFVARDEKTRGLRGEGNGIGAPRRGGGGMDEQKSRIEAFRRRKTS